MLDNIVLDSYALLALLEKEPAGKIVHKLLTEAEKTQKPLSLSSINLAEVYYRTIRKKNLKEAKITLSVIRKMPIAIFPATDDRVLAAAEIKGTYPISLGDCFAVALALEKKAAILTGDPEFKKVKKLVKIRWL